LGSGGKVRLGVRQVPRSPRSSRAYYIEDDEVDGVDGGGGGRGRMLVFNMLCIVGGIIYADCIIPYTEVTVRRHF
jgi:hypothetical protein